MLEVRGVSAGYGAIEVLRDLSLNLGAGEIVTVLGANGVGKTTLNRVLSGMVRPRSGTLRFDGQNLAACDPARIVSMGLIHVPEGRKIFPTLSVRENLQLGAYLRGRDRQRQNLERVLGTFPRLQERLRQPAGSLSGGEQQMLAIGRGLMSDPRMLILDEPSLGLSPLLTEELFALISALNRQGLPILLVEQNAYQSLSVAHRAYVIELGTVSLSGQASELLVHPGLRASYLGL
jgi:branched-chain amino acid transport system ATP-binding protein